MKTGLIIEGGALRSAFSCGVLKRFLEAGVQFDTVIATGAGALAAVYYRAGQGEALESLYGDYFAAKGEIGRSKLFAVRFARFLQAMGLPDNGKSREINDYYEEQLALHPDLIPGALAALDELAEVATLAVVSNGAYKVQQARIQASGIDRYLDGVYISEKVGAAKPSPRLFEHALRDLGVNDRSRVLVVGDDLLADIQGGRNAGLDTCWVNFSGAENDTGVVPGHTIASFEELYRLVMEPEELENVGVRNRRHMGDR